MGTNHVVVGILTGEMHREVLNVGMRSRSSCE